MSLQILAPLHTYPEANSSSLARHLTSIAKYLNADLHVLALTADFPPVSSALGTLLVDVPAMIRDAQSTCRRNAKALVEAIQSEATPKGVQLRVTDTECFPPNYGELVAKHARYHDLIAVGLGTSELAPSTAEGAIFGSGKPTLLLPEKSAEKPYAHVMIAWDGGRASARAVADGFLFLRQAAKVTVVSVTDEKKLPHNDPAAQLAAYLARRDIKAAVANVEGGRYRPIAELLQEHAQKIDAGLMIMGAFGHSRVRDFVLGGATNGVLSDLRLPVLLAH